MSCCTGTNAALGSAAGGRVCGTRGQASVELIGILPLALLIALGAGQLLAAGSAREQSGNAAEAGAVAMLQGRDPRAAANAALERDWRERAAIRVSGHRVEVSVRPRAFLPGVARLLAATAVADATPPS